MKQYVCRNLFENFRQIGQKMNVIAYVSWVVSRESVQSDRAGWAMGIGV